MFYEKAALKNSQYSQENTWVGVSFDILKKDSKIGVSVNTINFFKEHLQTAASDYSSATSGEYWSPTGIY